MPSKIFDLPDSRSIADAKTSFLDRLLPGMIHTCGIKTALDVGAGVGYFTRYLVDLGLEVTAIDGRADNVREIKARTRGAKAIVQDVEADAIRATGPYDLVLCFGLLYHLENPFLAIRNLEAITGKVLVIETVVAPMRGPQAILLEEPVTEDQGLTYCALIPTESAFVKMLYKAGFPRVYESLSRPDHRDFRSTLLGVQRRTILIASKAEQRHPMLTLVTASKQTNRYAWYKFGFAGIMENETARRSLKTVLKPVLHRWRVDSQGRRRDGAETRG